jgi:hypothetical protein
VKRRPCCRGVEYWPSENDKSASYKDEKKWHGEDAKYASEHGTVARGDVAVCSGKKSRSGRYSDEAQKLG